MEVITNHEGQAADQSVAVAAGIASEKADNAEDVAQQAHFRAEDAASSASYAISQAEEAQEIASTAAGMAIEAAINTDDLQAEISSLREELASLKAAKEAPEEQSQEGTAKEPELIDAKAEMDAGTGEGGSAQESGETPAKQAGETTGGNDSNRRRGGLKRGRK